MKLRGWAVACALLVLPTVSGAQDFGGGRRRGGGMMEFPANVPYDGRFTFARIRYEASGGRREPPWAHDYPRGERHFTKILGELSSVRVRTLASNILTLDDPELFKYPVAYMSEPGFWVPSEAEVLGLRNYLTKGGFLIFDDFEEYAYQNLEAQMKRVLPKLKPVKLTADDKIFDSFYKINSLAYVHPYNRRPSEFWGYFVDNDRTKRLIAIVNYNNDMSEYWEFSDVGFFPLDLSNDAYKLGVNYLIYALTR